MLNIVIPMAGHGSRFSKAGYLKPKPLIEIHGHPMIKYVINNIKPKTPHRFIFIVLKDHISNFKIDVILKQYEPNCEIVTINEVTKGAACTVLQANKFINNENPLMIANSDQYIDFDINDYLSQVKNMDGLILTMIASGNKWSYVKKDSLGLVKIVKEKVQISNEATVGIYNYKKGKDFVKYAKLMIEKNIMVNNEFYVAPVYNEFINMNKKIITVNIGEEGEIIHGLGVPEDLEKFIKLPLSKKIFGEQNDG